MKSIFFSKTLLWRITFTFIALLAVAGLTRLNKTFSSIEVKDASSTIYPGETSDSVAPQDKSGRAQSKLDLNGGEEKQQGTDGDNTGKNGQQIKNAQFFIEYRMQRDRARGQQIDLLREIVDNANSSEDVRKEAQRRLLNISQLLEKEMEIENMIRAKDFKDAVVFLQDKTATVIVQAKELSAEEERKIREIVNRTAAIQEGEVVIIPKA